MSEVSLNLKLSKAQAKKLISGKTVQLKNDQLTGGEYSVNVSKAVHNRFKRAVKNQTGLRLQLTQDQIASAITGQGFSSFIKKSVKGAKKIGKKIYEDVVKPSAKALKKSAQQEATNFLLESLGSNDVMGSLKAGAKGRSKKFATDTLVPELRKVASNSIAVGEKEIEDRLIESGLPEELVRAVITSSSVRLNNHTKEQLDNLETELQGMGFIKGSHYTRRGGAFSFKKLWRGIKKVAKPIWKIAKPVVSAVARPLLSAGVSALTGNAAAGAMSAPAIDAGLRAIGLGAKRSQRKSLKGSAEMAERMANLRARKQNIGGALAPLGGFKRKGQGLAPMGGFKRGGALKQIQYSGYVTNPQSVTGQFLI